jgi:hypothetical protein
MALKPIVAAAVLAACFAASAARADTTTLAKAGGWEAFGGTTNKGRPVCGLSIEPPNRYFGLKLFAGDETFTIQLSDKAWSITDKSKYGVSMRFDNNRVWTASAAGMHFTDGDPGAEFTIRKGELTRFNREFGSSKMMRLQYTNGMDDWAVDLAAAHEVNSKFAECNAKLK